MLQTNVNIKKKNVVICCENYFATLTGYEIVAVINGEVLTSCS
jgi:hypothetical protein